MTKLDKNGWPEIDLGLITWLKEKYPLKSPEINEPEREIYFNAGRQSLITELMSMNQVQEAGIVEQDVMEKSKYMDINLNREEDTS